MTLMDPTPNPNLPLPPSTKNTEDVVDTLLTTFRHVDFDVTDEKKGGYYLNWADTLPLLAAMDHMPHIEGAVLQTILMHAANIKHPDNWRHIRDHILPHRSFAKIQLWIREQSIANALSSDQFDLADGLLDHLSPNKGNHFSSFNYTLILKAAAANGAEDLALKALRKLAPSIGTDHFQTHILDEINFETTPVLYGEVQKVLAARDLDTACENLTQHGHPELAEKVKLLKQDFFPS